MQNGNLTHARAQVAEALTKYPASPELHNFLGVLEAQEGRYREAEANFQKAIDLDRQLGAAYLNLGRLYQENGARDKEAVRKGAAVYLNLLKVDPQNMEAHYQAAYMLQLEGSYQAALNLVARLPAPLQRKAQVLAVRCAAEVGVGRIGIASATAKQLLQSPEFAEADVLIVEPVLAAKKQARLETMLLEALAGRQLASRDSLVHLAALYEAQGQLGPAREALEKAAASGPFTLPLLTSLAQVAYKQQDRQGALGYLAHARDLDPKSAPVHFFFGMVCVEMDLPVEAGKSLAEAVTLDPNNAYYNYALGAVTVQVRKWEEAIPYFQKYVELKPDDPRGKLALATARFHSHQEDIARKELEEVVRYPQTAAGAHLYLGKLALREDDFARAEQELKLSLKANADNAEGLAELGFVYVQQEHYPQAGDVLGRSLKLQPDGVRANMALLTLYQRTDDRRAERQAARVQEVIQKREENAKALLRTIEVRPY